MPDSTSRSRTFTWEDPVQLAAAGRELSGLDFLRKMIAGELPRPPIAALVGVSLIDVEVGRAVFELEPAEWMFNPIGSVHGGIAATILDSCMGCAIHSTLPAGKGYTTADLQVRYIRGMDASTGRVLAEGKVVHAGRRHATAESTLIAQNTGKLIAHGTTGCTIL